MAQSKWVESGRLDTSEVSAICKRASDVRTLARTQMTSPGNERWTRLSRQELVVEAFVMGTPPLDPRRCYLVARAGRVEETARRVFEVRDFAVSAESTSVFVIGRGFELPPKSGEPSY
jgi:hypothetical protein